MNLLKNTVFFPFLSFSLPNQKKKKKTEKCIYFGTVKYLRLGEHSIMIPLHHLILGITQIQSLWLEQNHCCSWTSGHKSIYQCYFSFFCLSNQIALWWMPLFSSTCPVGWLLYIAMEHHLILNRIQDINLWKEASIMSLFNITHLIFFYDNSQSNIKNYTVTKLIQKVGYSTAHRQCLL